MPGDRGARAGRIEPPPRARGARPWRGHRPPRGACGPGGSQGVARPSLCERGAHPGRRRTAAVCARAWPG
eukprot:392926-Prymnesium_polylepis.1